MITYLRYIYRLVSNALIGSLLRAWYSRVIFMDFLYPSSIITKARGHQDRGVGSMNKLCQRIS